MRHRALVTGASRGIGAAIAEALAAQGHDVIITFRDRRDAAEEVRDRILSAGGNAEIVQFDVGDRAACERELARIVAAQRPVDILVNNAGVSRDAPLAGMEPGDWDLVLRTSLDGFYNVTRPLVLPMVRQRWGRIITITSISGLVGNRGQTNYAAAKAGLVGATKALSLELARRGVTVNAVAPGLIDTDMIKGAPVEDLVKLIPMQRLGRVEEVAAVVAFLASDAASYVTGQVIGVTGGLA